MKRKKCLNAGAGCFSCPLPDCTYDGAPTDTEQKMYAVSGLHTVTRAHRKEVMKRNERSTERH